MSGEFSRIGISAQRLRKQWRVSTFSALVLLVLLAGVLLVLPRSQAVRAAPGDWVTYMNDNSRSGFNGTETVITQASAPTLKVRWTAQAGGAIFSQPVVANGLIYWGSFDGYEHATNVSGTQVWQQNVGVTTTCTPYNKPLGVVSTAAVASVSINGTPTSVVFVGGGDDNFYALNAATGAVIWKILLGAPSTNTFIWDSPLVYNNSIYIGTATTGEGSGCKLVPGQFFQLNAVNGSILHSANMVPAGCLGGGIWTSPTLDTTDGSIYVATGTQGTCNEAYAIGLVKFRTSDLSVVSSWVVPESVRVNDSDFGASPTLFTATIGGTPRQLVGAVDKNGIYYALDRTALSNGPVWQAQIAVGGPCPQCGQGSISSSAWDGSRLYVAGGNTTIGGTTCKGSLRALNPVDGSFIWEHCLPDGPVMGAVTAVPGVVAVVEGPMLVLVNATTGQTLLTSNGGNNANFYGSASISNGALYVGSQKNGLYAFTVSGGPAPSPTLSPPAGSGPVNSIWYFAEGRIGKGFREYLTIGNPTTGACAVNVKYLYTMDGSSTPTSKTVSLTVSSASRMTESVNADLGLADSSTAAASLAAIVTVNTTTTPACPGVVAERPMYFSNYHGISSGTDVIGSTKLNTTYDFADVPTGSSSSGSYTSYITILNPNAATANVTVTYYANGNQVQTQTLAVSANARGTIAPGAVTLPQHVTALVSSNQPIMVERPTYFSGINGTSGAYDVVGAPKTATDWFFAEGYTGAGYQEDLTIANLDLSRTAAVTITLKSGTGATRTTNLTVGPKSQTIWNVNAANTFSGSTPEVSAEVTAAATGASIVVQRELYFTYKHTLPQQARGGTDVMGQIGPAAPSAYSFAEGYTNTGYNEWLTIQNPTANTETIDVTLVNGVARSATRSFPVTANSRFTLDVTALVQQVFTPGTNSAGNSISMTVQTPNNTAFVAERPMYWNTAGLSSFVTVGGSDVLGYVGG